MSATDEANSSKYWLLKETPAKQAEFLATRVIASVGGECSGKDAFYRGLGYDGNSAYWSVRCTNGREYQVKILADADGATSVIDCETLLIMNGSHCFQKIGELRAVGSAEATQSHTALVAAQSSPSKAVTIEPTPVSGEKPPEQIKFEALIAKWRDAYKAANNSEKPEVRKKRAAELCAEFPTGDVRNWQGTIKDFYPMHTGDGYLWVGVTEFLKFWTTDIPPQSKPFALASKLKKGEAVKFSGTINKDESGDDCFSETSFSESGSMGEPDFTMWFTGLALGANSAVPDEALKDALNCSIQGPNFFVTRIISNKEAELSLTAQDSKLTVVYKIDPWALTAGTSRRTFLSHAKDIVPDIFEQCPQFSEVEVRIKGMFVDKRGNESSEDAAWIRFTRNNAATVNWKNVLSENLPDIADKSWLHPALRP